MTTGTFEDELRSLLQITADAEGPAFVDVDPGAVLFQGRRVVRRRRIATGAGIAAAAVTLGLAGAATLGGGPDRTSEPATSTSAPSATGPVSVDLTRTAAVGDAWGAPNGQPSVRVGVDVRRRTWTSARISDVGAVSQPSTGTLPANPLSSTVKPDQGAPAVVTGVLPASAVAVSWIWAGKPQTFTQGLAPLPGTPYKAFAVWHADGRASRLVGLDWTDGESVFSVQGTKVPSMTQSGAIGFADPSQQSVGVYVDGQMYTSPIGRNQVHSVPTVSVVGSSATKTEFPVTVFALFPPGARAIEVSAEGAVDETQTLDLGAAVGTGVLVRAAPAFDPATTGVTMTWTNADGTPGSLDADASR